MKKKNSIKRAQSQARLSFAERKNFRPMAKILTLLVLLMTAVTGAVAQTPELLVTIESRQNSDFIFGSMTFGGKAIVTFSNDVGNAGDNWGWYTYPGSGGSLLTVTSVEGYTITSCKFYTEGSGDAVNGYTIEGESPSVYLINIGVFTDASQSVKIGDPGITKIEVYGYADTPAGPTDYYLVGNMTSWGINPQYKLALNESAGNANEYQIALVLPAATELKVVSSTDGTTIKDWFPDGQGNNKYVQNDGLYTIYFRPGYNGGDDWHANCIYVADGVSFTADGEAWTLAQMPACDVELEVEYFPLATLATQPAAAEGVVEGTDAALLTPGTSAEGTLAYAIGTSEAPTGQWSDAIPTAQDLEAGTCYVWYKVVGNAEHSDSQPQSIAVTIAEAPAYAVTIDDAGVDASNWQATPAEPKTGQTVTLSYGGKKKIRSITIEKAATAPAAAIAPALMDGATVVIEYNCDGFVTNFTFTNNGGTYSCNITGDESDGYSASLTKQGNTLVFVAHHSDIPDSFDSTINFDTTSDTYSFAKKAGEFWNFKISVNGTDITDKLSETAPTLAETMTTAGMTVKVKYNFFREELNYCQFLSNGDGTYTFQSGTGDLGGDEDGDHHDKALVVEGGKLVFKQSYYTFDFEWDKVGYSVTFDTSNNTYSEWWGKDASEDEYSFISVEVNGTTIAVTAAQ